MNRPWIEANPLLATVPVHTGPWPAPAPQIAPGIPFAVLERPQDARSKPRAYPDSRRLARWITRRRRGRPIRLETSRLKLREGVSRRGVLVWIEDGDAPREFVGWCWLSGQGQLALQDALHAFDRRGLA